MHVECGRAVFGRQSKFSTRRCRKCNFVLIHVKVGVLLTFLASMKAKVHLYQKYVSIFPCLHVKKRIHSCVFQVSILNYPLRLSDTELSCWICWESTSNSIGYV